MGHQQTLAKVFERGLASPWAIAVQVLTIAALIVVVLIDWGRVIARLRRDDAQQSDSPPRSDID